MGGITSGALRRAGMEKAGGVGVGGGGFGALVVLLAGTLRTAQRRSMFRDFLGGMRLKSRLQKKLTIRTSDWSNLHRARAVS